MGMEKEHEYEVVSNTGATPEVVASFWWDGKKVRCSSPRYLERANQYAPMNLTARDGIDFLEALPQVFRSGYMTCRRAKKNA